jgi:ATP-dependent helicase/nuclease subunit A
MRLDDATIAQNRAAEPGSSTWLSANAGSGKTRVLTDRVARLLLDRVPPQNILCLTYTKAAASEMQNRLFRRLGAWAMKPDGALAQELQAMGETEVGDPARLAEARRLFARAIETPGGLRIQTIHSFCASLLRRFPLEAGVTPAFVEMDDGAARRLREAVVEDLAAGGDVGAVDAVAALYTGEDLTALTGELVSRAEDFTRRLTFEQALALFGLPGGTTRESLLRGCIDGSEPALVAQLKELCRDQSKTYQSFATDLGALDLSAPDEACYRELCRLFLYASGDKEGQSKSVNFPQSNHKKAVEALAPVLPELHAFMDRVAWLRQQEHCLRAAERAAALHRFAAAFLPAYEKRKARHGWLDFDDLIRKTRQLLSDPAVADWVLFRLDGGLDHILVDEAQDTSPAQWQVIERLAQEFTTGRGARDGVRRTIFVVGDKKQSIYSFQGAEPEEFDRMRDHFRAHAEGAQQPFQRRELEYSFRSSEAVLRLVDTVFTAVPGAEMAMDARHRAFRSALPGRVDLWPPVPKPDKLDKPHWYDPMDLHAANHQDVVLARQIARRITRMVGTETIPTPAGDRRPVRAGDILILVRRRSTLFEEIIRACKAEGLPVAGADRLKLGGELAVKDVGALLSFLATPEDDLSLAAALRSPLFGWSEAELHALAAGRGRRRLWPVLRERAEAHPETLAMLRDLLGQTDFLRPYDLVERILSRHDGRRRLLARLGPEAEDGIDSLLTQALGYERMQVPSLTGFLTWLQTEEVEVKRQLDTAGDQIRVMTVHGAKGLESPVVILPDTNKRQQPLRNEVVRLAEGAAVWKAPAAQQPPAMGAALEALKARQGAEALRLLYVALTRAETWLIVAAAGDVGSEPADCWHGMVAAAMQELGAQPLETPAGEGLRLSHLDWDAGPLVTEAQAAPPEVTLPDWLDRPAPTPPAPRTVSPSDLGGAKVLGSEGEGDLEAALRRGRQVHLLLELLPAVPPERRAATGRALLAQSADPAEGAEAEALLAEADRVLRMPELAFLFAPGVLSEVDVTAEMPGGQRMHGTIDKLLVAGDRVLAVDFKTNRILPEHPAQVPEGLLRQMAAYDLALRQVYPDRRVETAILWTTEARLMPLPHDIVRATLQSPATS